MEWLHPWALWLGATLAFPVWLHLKQRSRPKDVDFPSLMLLRRGFPQAMQQQRLRDLLQLILRLLLLLCLVLAIAQPVRRDAAAWPTRGTLLLDNTVTGMLPDALHGNRLAAQWHESRALAERLPDGLLRIAVLTDAPAALAEERFGDMPEAVRRLLATEPVAQAQGHLLVLPVADWRLIESLTTPLAAWLKAHPERRLLLWDMPSSSRPRNPLPQFRRIELTRDTGVSSPAPLMRLQAEATGPEAAVRALLQRQGGLETEIPPEQGSPASAASSRFSVRLPSGAWQGRFRLKTNPDALGPWNTFHFATSPPVTGRVLHLGSTWATLASLSGPGDTPKVEHWPTGNMPPLDARGASQVVAVMLADETPATEILEQLAGLVIDGAGLILALGPHTDVVAVNSRLLAPLGLGRIRGVKRSASPLSLRPGPASWAALHLDADALGRQGGFGEVSQYFEQEVSPEAQVLLTAGDAKTVSPIAVLRKAGKGQVLLWNTLPDSLGWTSLGLQPLLPLIHQAFLQSLHVARQPVELASDSTWTWPTLDPQAQVLDPDGKPFLRVQSTLAGLRLGPFAKTGLYACRSVEETTWVAVNLLSPWQRLPWGDPVTDEADGHGQASARAAALKRLQGFEGQVIRVSSHPSAALQRQGMSTWPIWVAMAVLLLLLDGLVALILGPRKSNRLAS